jgi:hypothetical protein
LNIKISTAFLIITTLFFDFSGLTAWTDHFYGAYYSLVNVPEFKKQVTVESLESFLAKEADKLALELDKIEDTSKKEIPGYRDRPEALKFNPKDTKNLRVNFLKALRLNTGIKLALFVQEIPSKENLSKKSIPYQNVTIFEEDEGLKKYIFSLLKEGGKTTALQVTASAADEPDYGLDIGLFEDSLDKTGNPSEMGQTFNFGKQAFGDPKKFYSSQAPLHMGFYHEPGIIYAAAGWVRDTFPDMRILQFSMLSKFAFATGHEYWGYRFMGWGMHYIGDLTQPYHSTLTPGVGTATKMIANLIPPWYNKIRDKMSDRHTAIEHYQFHIMRKAISENPDSELLGAYSHFERDKEYKDFSFSYIRDVLSKESNSKADTLDDVLDDNEEVLKFKEDRDVELTVNDNDKVKKTNAFLIDLFSSFGSHTRNFAKFILGK